MEIREARKRRLMRAAVIEQTRLLRLAD